MKKLLIIILSIIGTEGIAQTVNGDVINARKNFFLRNYRVDTIMNDTMGLDGKVKSLITANAVYDFVNGRLAGIGGGGGSGTVTSVGLSMPSAFNVAGSPITGAGSFTVTGAGSTSQYIRGNGTLSSFLSDVRGGISLTTTGSSGAATYNSATGVFNIPIYAGATGASGYIQNQYAGSQAADYYVTGQFRRETSSASTEYVREILSNSGGLEIETKSTVFENRMAKLSMYFTNDDELIMLESGTIGSLNKKILMGTTGIKFQPNQSNTATHFFGQNSSGYVTLRTASETRGDISAQAAIQFKDEGTNIGTAGAVTNVDFVGTGVTATHSSGTVTVNIAGGGGDLTVGTTSITSGTAGRILFQNNSNVLEQSGSLFWDNTNSTLGIGTSSPSNQYRQTIKSNATITRNLLLSSDESYPEFISFNSAFGQSAYLTGTFKGVELVLPLSDGGFRISRGATGIQTFNLEKGVTANLRSQQKQATDISSTNNITLGSGNVFEVTGATQINLINNTDWQEGGEVKLLFSEAVTVKNGQSTSGNNTTILLANGIDFTAEPGDILSLVYSERAGVTAWREVSRSRQSGSVTEGSYTPTITNGTNVAASTAYTTHYIKTGDVVHVWGTVDIDATSSLTITEIGMTLPISSAISQTYDLAGSATHEDNTVVQIKGEAATDRATWRFTPQTNTNNKYSFHFTYKYYAP